MGKPKGVIAQRWNIVDPDKQGGEKGGKRGSDEKKENGCGGGGKNEDAKVEQKKDDEPKKMTEAERKAAAKEAKQAAEAKPAEKAENPKSNNGGGEKKAASKVGSKSGSEARFTMGEWVTLQEDDIFSFGELQLLSELIAQYDLGRWQMVASRFFDKTGRRVHPDDVRDKFVALE